MLQLFSRGIVAIFAVIGLMEVIRWVCNENLLPKETDWALMVVPLTGREDAEFLLRSAIQRVRWSLRSRNMKLICLDCGMSPEIREVCLRLSQQYAFVQIVNSTEFQKKYSGQDCNKGKNVV